MNVQHTTRGASRGLNLRTCLTMIVMIMACSIGLRAQYFTVFGIDDSNFPRMKARFVALDAAGNEYRNFSNNEFVFLENGAPMNATMTIDCKDTAVQPAANVVLILDRSGSMSTIVDTATKETRMDWVIAGATNFLNTFKFIPPSEVAVISFGTLPTFESPFRTTAPPLISVISKLKPQGGTDYNPPMLDTSFGAIKLLTHEPPGIRRIVIFLTDGQPDHAPYTDSIITLCNSQSIQFYAITIGTSMNNDLRTIATKTGGKAFEAKTKTELEAIYRLIALETEIKQNCFLYWTAPYSCNQSGRIRDLDVQFKRPSPPIKSTPRYIAPANSVASINLSQSTLYFGDPAPGGSTTQTVTITASNSPLIVTALNPVPSGFFTVTDYGGGKSLPDTIKIGEKRVVTIRFTQGGTKAYRQASLVVSGSPCPPTVSLFGGLSSVQVVYPNGAELFSTCDTIEIKWAGVDPTQGINIFYALDGDKPNPTWVLIKQNATGLSYKWAPPVSGKNLRIRMTAQPAPTYLWTRSLGSTMLDTCRSIALDQSQFFVHSAGTFMDTLKVNTSNKTFPSYGGKDAFVSRFDSDGNLIWVQTAGGTSDDGCAAVTTDDQDGIYVAGYYTSKAVQFGSTQLSLPPFDQINLYVARYDPAGNATWVRTGGGSSTSTGYAYADSISFDKDSIYVFGRYKNKLRIQGYWDTPGYLELNHTPTPPSTTPFKFVASFSKTGVLGSLIEGYRTHPYTDSTVTDKNGNLYDAGYFKGTQNNGGTSVNLQSRGDYDCFIRKFGGQPGSSDSSDGVFKITSPQLTFKQTVLNCPTISVGQASDTTYTAQLCNTGDIPVLIAKNGSTITGPNKEDFKLTSNYDDKVIYPGDCVNIEIHFQPQTVDGSRLATLQIAGTCGAPATVDLQGIALPPCRFEPDVPYIGCQSVNIPKVVHDPCLIRNMAANDYSGKISLIGVNPDEFSIKLLSTGEVITSTSGKTNFTLMKNGACMDAEITFTPKGSGTRTAVILFDIPFECGSVAQINLIGCGIAPQIKIDPIDFGMHRVNTTTRLAANISNPDTLDALLSTISLASVDANFQIDAATMPTLPYNLRKGQNIKVDVLYNPQSQGPHGNYVKAEVAGNSTPTQGEVKGEGFIPQMESYDLSFVATPVGSAAPVQTLLIRNTHQRADLLVKKVSNPDNPDFTFNTTPPTDTIVKPGDTLKLDVTLRPKAGNNVGHVTITTDALPGPTPSPSIDTVVTLRGEGLKVDIDPQPASYGDVLICDSTETRSVTITNNGASSINVDVTGSGDTTAFDVQPAAASITLGAGESKTYVVRFRGLANSHTMSLNFGLPSGNISRDFTARGVGTSISFVSSGTTFQVGGRSNYPIEISTPTLTNVLIHRIEFDIKLDSSSILFDTTNFKRWYGSAVNGWTWTYQRSSALSSTVRIIGTNAAGFPGGKFTFGVPLWLLQVYVASIPVTVTWANPNDYPCLTASITNGSILAKVACFAEGSRITLTGVDFAIQIAPNPVTSNVLNVNYSVGMNDIPYELELYNTMGERVMLLGHGIVTSGVYEKEVDISSVANGVYYVRLSAGPYSETKILNINK